MTFRTVYIPILAALIVAGCTAPQVQLKPPHQYAAASPAEGRAWHHLRVQWRWPEGEKPRWELDLLFADRVLSPLINRHQGSITLWRFHRRAARDAAGHQFSFLFYSPADTAGRVLEAAEDHRMTRRLARHGAIERVHLTQPDDPQRLASTSDPDWPETLQATWPMFIMGVSQTWLALVEVHAAGTGPARGDLEAELARYRDIAAGIDELWVHNARHAFFHHISGVFGYKSVLVRY